MEDKKPTLEDYARYSQMLNPTKLKIVCILYAAEKLEEMEMERKQEAEKK